MIRLVIVTSLIAIGNVRGQQPISPGVINMQILSNIPLDARTFVVPEQGRLVSVSPQVLQRNPVQRVESTDRSRPRDGNNSDLNLRSPTLRKNQPNRRPFIPQTTPDRINRPDRTMLETNRTSVEQNIGTPVNTEVNVNPNQYKPPVQYSPLLSNTTQSNMTVDNLETTVNTGLNDASTVKNEQVFPKASNVNGTTEQPSVDERSSFDGDKCPTGYVRINDMCVETD